MMGIDKLYEQVSNRNEQITSEKNRLDDLVKEVTGVRNNLTFLRSEIQHLLNDPEYDPDYPGLLKVIKGELVKILEMYPERYRVVIGVSGGIAEVITCPDEIDVEIIDHDNETHA